MYTKKINVPQLPPSHGTWQYRPKWNNDSGYRQISNSMTFPHLSIFHDFSRPGKPIFIFNDFSWPWEPCVSNIRNVPGLVKYPTSLTTSRTCETIAGHPLAGTMTAGLRLWHRLHHTLRPQDYFMYVGIKRLLLYDLPLWNAVPFGL